MGGIITQRLAVADIHITANPLRGIGVKHIVPDYPIAPRIDIKYCMHTPICILNNIQICSAFHSGVVTYTYIFVLNAALSISKV